MSIADDATRQFLTDGRWFPLRFDGRRDEFQFVLVPPERHRETAFLTYIEPSADEVRSIARSAVSEADLPRAPLHFILHEGFGGSTLLGKLLAQPGAAITLQEPPILTDIAAYGSALSSTENEQLQKDATRLLSRPISEGEAIVCKSTHLGNGLAYAMAASRPTSQILCLQTPLQEMLLSLALRGLEGRVSARKIFISLRNSKMGISDLAGMDPLTDRHLAHDTDLELAALAWLSMQKMMVETAKRLGPERVRSISTRHLMQDPRAALRLAAEHFRLELDVEKQVTGGLLDRHSKTGEPFNPERRAERIAEGLRFHRSEIAPVVKWARKIAERTGTAWELPYPLLEAPA
jgi:hypothetical protein